jgi:hypothetical protein
MATTRIIGIRNNLDAANFLAYDFLNNGGNDNPMLFTGLSKAGGRTLGIGVVDTMLDRGYRYVDTVDTSVIFERVRHNEWDESSPMPSDLPPALNISQGYVYLLLNDDNLTNLQNRIWTYYSNNKRSGGFGSYVSAPWLSSQYDPASQNTVLTKNSMWIGDTARRRALWDGVSPGNTLASGYDSLLVSPTVQPGSVVGYSGAPSRYSATVGRYRYIPGYNTTNPNYYLEPQLR